MSNDAVDLLNSVPIAPDLLREMATVTWPTVDSFEPGMERSERVCEEIWLHLVNHDFCDEGVDPMDVAVAITARIFALHQWVGEHLDEAHWYGPVALFKAACTEAMCPIDGQALFDPDRFQEALALSSGEV